MRVLTFAALYLPGFRGGGPVRSIANLVERLGGEVDFRIVTGDRDYGCPDPYPGIEPFQWTPVGKGTAMYLPPDAWSGSRLREIIAETAPDAIYLNSLFHPRATVAVLRQRNLLPPVPIIIAPRGELSPDALRIKSVKKRLFLAAAKRMRLYDGLHWQASSEYEEADIRRFLGGGWTFESVRIAPDLPPVLGPLPPRAPKQAGRLRAVFLARLTRIKNLDYALRCLEGIRGEVDLDVVGPHEDAGYVAECRSIADRLPGNVRIHFQGAVGPDEIPKILADAHLLFFPTQSENFGHVIPEALAAGCPVLISDRTPWRDLASRGVGWDLPLGAPNGFRERVQQMIDLDADEFSEMSLRARTFAEEVSRAEQALAQNRALFAGLSSRAAVLA